jgi:hypothetical protein
MQTKKIFLASSSELKVDRQAFEMAIRRKNKDLFQRGVFLELVIWDNFLDAVSKAWLQDKYKKAIRECDVFVMLLWTKMGKYTEPTLQLPSGSSNRPASLSCSPISGFPRPAHPSQAKATEQA